MSRLDDVLDRIQEVAETFVIYDVRAPTNDARRLAAILSDESPVPRVSPWFGYAPVDPAQVASKDGIVFVKDAD